jgi:hypothetical protein
MFPAGRRHLSGVRTPDELRRIGFLPVESVVNVQPPSAERKVGGNG